MVKRAWMACRWKKAAMTTLKEHLKRVKMAKSRRNNDIQQSKDGSGPPKKIRKLSVTKPKRRRKTTIKGPVFSSKGELNAYERETPRGKLGEKKNNDTEWRDLLSSDSSEEDEIKE
jgi:hypothetical protein